MQHAQNIATPRNAPHRRCRDLGATRSLNKDALDHGQALYCSTRLESSCELFVAVFLTTDSLVAIQGLGACKTADDTRLHDGIDTLTINRRRLRRSPWFSKRADMYASESDHVNGVQHRLFFSLSDL
jgi:hypothetical protein